MVAVGTEKMSMTVYLDFPDAVVSLSVVASLRTLQVPSANASEIQQNVAEKFLARHRRPPATRRVKSPLDLVLGKIVPVAGASSQSSDPGLLLLACSAKALFRIRAGECLTSVNIASNRHPTTRRADTARADPLHKVRPTCPSEYLQSARKLTCSISQVGERVGV